MMKFKDMVDSGYFMYMAEAEGHDKLVNTRTAKVNAVIKDLQYVVSCGENPYNHLDRILFNHDLCEEMLTDEECRRISNCVR